MPEIKKVCSGSGIIHAINPEIAPTPKIWTLCGVKTEPVQTWDSGGPAVTCKRCIVSCKKIEAKYG